MHKLDEVRDHVDVLCLDEGRMTTLQNITTRDALATVAMGGNGWVKNMVFHSIGNHVKVSKTGLTAWLEHNDMAYSCLTY